MPFTWPSALFVLLSVAIWMGAHHVSAVAPSPYATPAQPVSGACEWIGLPQYHPDHHAVLHSLRSIESLSDGGRRALASSVDTRAALARRPTAEFRACFTTAEVLVEHQALAITGMRDLNEALAQLALLWRQSLQAGRTCGTFDACLGAQGMLADTLAAMEDLYHRARARRMPAVQTGVRWLARASGELRVSWRSELFARSYEAGRREILLRRGACGTFDAAYTETIWRDHHKALANYAMHATPNGRASRLQVPGLPYNLCGAQLLRQTLRDPAPLVDRLVHQAAVLESWRIAIGQGLPAEGTTASASE